MVLIILQISHRGIYHGHGDTMQGSFKELLPELTHSELLGLGPQYCLIWIHDVWFNIIAAHYFRPGWNPWSMQTGQRGDNSIHPLCFSGWQLLTIVQEARLYKGGSSYQKPHEFLHTAPHPILKRSGTSGKQMVVKLWVHSWKHLEKTEPQVTEPWE